MPSQLAVYTNSVFYRHDTGPGHPERSARIDAALAGVERAGLGGRLVRDPEEHPDTERVIRRVHTPEYARDLEEAVRAGHRRFHSLDNPISAATFLAARAAVSIALNAADRIWGSAGETDHDASPAKRAFIVARPPGHHAERAEAMGFCFFNTIACVAEWLRQQPAIERVLIFDFDVHHGNGTQHLFELRDDVYYTSTHRYPFYPGTGAAREIGEGRGKGFTKNIPLTAGQGDAALLRATEDQIVRIIDDYRPNAILLSAGFDAHRHDPLGGMNVTEEGYGQLTRRIVECAERWCGGRLLSLLEGGYDLEGLAASVALHTEALDR
jgi:acetoin utilization deacetylase AcuC-like enzyme